MTQLGQRLALDLADALARHAKLAANLLKRAGVPVLKEIGRASCRERV